MITKRIAENDVGLRLDTPQLGTLFEGMKDREPDLYRAGAGRAAGGERVDDSELTAGGDHRVFGGARGLHGRDDPDQRSEARPLRPTQQLLVALSRGERMRLPAA